MEAFSPELAFSPDPAFSPESAFSARRARAQRPAVRPVSTPPDIRGFAATLRGRAILPADAAYDEARRVHDVAVDRRPAIVVKAAGADDVARTVRFATDAGLDLSVRSGGHSLAGYGTADDAVVLDLSGMKGLHIDVERRLAWAQPGLTAGEYGMAAAAHGLATPFGDTSSVGLGWITLGGGVGWLARKHGLAIDSLVSAEVVLADGSIVTTSESEHPDLFWAIRGGGGNFGVVTRFQYRLHPVSLVLGGALILPPTREVLEGLVPLARSAPEELTIITFFMPIPPLPMVPPEFHFQLGVIVAPVFAGDIEAGQRAMEPFRALATPIADATGPMPYTAMYDLTAGGAEPHASVTRSLFADDLDAASVDTILDRMGSAASPMVMTQIRVLGGAMGRVRNDATAFAHRDRDVMLTMVAMYEGDAAPHEAWVSDYLDALSPIARGVYSNFLMAEGEERVREAYPDGSYERLVEVKRRYDPDNVFHLNQNIRP
jgi:FAD/FMN-containing dehydrogenase